MAVFCSRCLYMRGKPPHLIAVHRIRRRRARWAGPAGPAGSPAVWERRLRREGGPPWRSTTDAWVRGPPPADPWPGARGPGALRLLAMVLELVAGFQPTFSPIPFWAYVGNKFEELPPTLSQRGIQPHVFDIHLNLLNQGRGDGPPPTYTLFII